MNLILQKCLVHADREAVVRCPSCGNYFCRECITEHEQKFLCSNCLRRVTTLVEPAERNANWLMTIVKMMVGIAVAWLFFYIIGKSLVLFPPNVHDGTFIRSLGQ